MGWAKIRGELTSRKGRPVRFGAPMDALAKGGGPGTGVIVDEVWATPELNAAPLREARSAGDWGDYSFCAQLIRWSWGGYSIRMAYYRRRAGEDHWEYASQMTVNAEPAIIKALLEKTLAQRRWFSDDPEGSDDRDRGTYRPVDRPPQ